jgi:hypothetical protein
LMDWESHSSIQGMKSTTASSHRDRLTVCGNRHLVSPPAELVVGHLYSSLWNQGYIGTSDQAMLVSGLRKITRANGAGGSIWPRSTMPSRVTIPMTHPLFCSTQG